MVPNFIFPLDIADMLIRYLVPTFSRLVSRRLGFAKRVMTAFAASLYTARTPTVGTYNAGLHNCLVGYGWKMELWVYSLRYHKRYVRRE
jgi:hypothetical protein